MHTDGVGEGETRDKTNEKMAGWRCRWVMGVTDEREGRRKQVHISLKKKIKHDSLYFNK